MADNGVGAVNPRSVVSGLREEARELGRIAVQERWGLVLTAIGWLHLAVFLSSYALARSGDETPLHYMGPWIGEAVLTAWILRRGLVRPGQRTEPLPGLFALVVRIWVTFLIVALNTVSLNRLTGLDHVWFRPVLASLSTFAFAMMAWLLHYGFFGPAVLMSLSGLLMARFPEHAYLFYALGWWISLNGIGLTLERKRETVGALDLSNAG